MERQKLWICIGIAFLLLLAVIAAVLISAPKAELHDSARFVSAQEQDRVETAYADLDANRDGAQLL